VFRAGLRNPVMITVREKGTDANVISRTPIKLGTKIIFVHFIPIST